MSGKERLGCLSILLIFLFFLVPIKEPTHSNRLAPLKTEAPVIQKILTEVPTVRPTVSPTAIPLRTQAPTISNDRIVYTNDDSGYRYHRFTCKYVKRTSTRTTISKARKNGFTPCKVCKPGG